MHYEPYEIFFTVFILNIILKYNYFWFITIKKACPVDEGRYKYVIINFDFGQCALTIKLY